MSNETTTRYALVQKYGTSALEYSKSTLNVSSGVGRTFVCANVMSSSAVIHHPAMMNTTAKT